LQLPFYGFFPLRISERSYMFRDRLSSNLTRHVLRHPMALPAPLVRRPFSGDLHFSEFSPSASLWGLSAQFLLGLLLLFVFFFFLKVVFRRIFKKLLEVFHFLFWRVIVPIRQGKTLSLFLSLPLALSRCPVNPHSYP